LKRQDNGQLTLHKRWAMDVEAFKNGAAWKISSPQCESCKHFIYGNAKNCTQYALPDQKPIFVISAKKECPKFEHEHAMTILPETRQEGQFWGGILGFCVGDALGVPVEFSSREERKKDPVQEMRAYGTHHQHFGTWSDDTSMTLCLIESLKDGYDLQDIADIFCKFYYEEHWTPYNEVFDIGNTTAGAIERMKSGMNPVECGGSHENDNGNGSLMRVLPLAFYLCQTEALQKVKIIEDVSSLTHAHQRSKLACVIYVELAINLFSHNKQDAYQNTIKFVSDHCSATYSNELGVFHRILNDELILADENNIRSSGYVVDSLEALIWAFMTTDNYVDAIFKAINLGGDTDTIAALTGGLAGLCYGVNAIPNNWIQCLARKNEIYNLIRDKLVTGGDLQSPY